MADRSEELWNSMLRPLPRDDKADQLVAPPRNPSAPADWASNLVLAGAGKVGNFLMAPGRAMEQGMTTGDAIPWAGNTAMMMTGGGAPVAAARGVDKSALGIGFPVNWRQFTQMGRSQQKTDEARAAIQNALKAGSPTNSGVPLINPTVGQKPSTEDVLEAIESALKLAPKKR